MKVASGSYRFPIEKLGSYGGQPVITRIAFFLSFRGQCRAMGVCKLFKQGITFESLTASGEPITSFTNSAQVLHAMSAKNEAIPKAISMRGIESVKIDCPELYQDAVLSQFSQLKIEDLHFADNITAKALKTMLSNRKRLTALILSFPIPIAITGGRTAYRPPAETEFTPISHVAPSLKKFEINDDATYPAITDGHLERSQLRPARLTELCLLGCEGITKDALATFIGSQKKLVMLNLTHTKVTPIVAQAFLASQLSLKTLILSRSIRDQDQDAVDAIYRSISQVCTVTYLDLSECQSTKTGLKAIKGLECLKTLHQPGPSRLYVRANVAAPVQAPAVPAGDPKKGPADQNSSTACAIL